jgi:hypothetical protein
MNKDVGESYKVAPKCLKRKSGIKSSGVKAPGSFSLDSNFVLSKGERGKANDLLGANAKKT